MRQYKPVNQGLLLATPNTPEEMVPHFFRMCKTYSDLKGRCVFGDEPAIQFEAPEGLVLIDLNEFLKVSTSREGYVRIEGVIFINADQVSQYVLQCIEGNQDMMAAMIWKAKILAV